MWELQAEWVNKVKLVFQAMRVIWDHRAPLGLQDQKVKRVSRAMMRSKKVLLVLQV